MMDGRTMEPFKTALAAILRDRDLEQLEVAAAAGLSEATISLYLAGKRKPRPESMEKLAYALGLEPAYFIEWRRWKLHSMLDALIAQDEEAVEFLLERWRLREGQTG